MAFSVSLITSLHALFLVFITQALAVSNVVIIYFSAITRSLPSGARDNFVQTLNQGLHTETAQQARTATVG